MESRRKKSIGLLLIFLLGLLMFYVYFDSTLEAEIEVVDFSGETKGAGYQSLIIDFKNLENNAVKPEFLLLNPSQRGPIKLKSNLSREVGSGETVSIHLETSNISYIPIIYNEEFMLILRDQSSQRSMQETISIDSPVEKTVYQNPELETFQGHPTGWKERFKGDVRKYNIKKGLTGVELELYQENSDGYFSYYLAQDFNLTENVKLIVDYENLEDAEAGFRILRENTYPSNEESIVDVELTEYTGQSSARMNETFNLREIYEKQNATYRKGETVQLQLFFESDQDTPNSIHWKEASIGNQ